MRVSITSKIIPKTHHLNNLHTLRLLDRSKDSRHFNYYYIYVGNRLTLATFIINNKFVINNIIVTTLNVLMSVCVDRAICFVELDSVVMTFSQLIQMIWWFVPNCYLLSGSACSPCDYSWCSMVGNKDTPLIAIYVAQI